MRINVAVPEAHVSAPVLDSALEAVTRLDESMIRRGELEPFDPEHPQARWRPEPPGQEHFDHGRLVAGRGWGDCDDLAPWRAASLRATGEDPGARAIVRKSGPSRWHALVRRSDGTIDDPSLDAGMPGPGRRGVRGAWQPPMGVSSCVGGTYIARPQLALRPVLDELSEEPEAWQARADLPWHASAGHSPGDVAMVSLHSSPTSDQALVGAVVGAIALGESSDIADEEHLDRLRCVADMLDGADWSECADEYGPEHALAASHVVGGLFKKFRRKMRRKLRPLARGFGRAARGIARDVVLPLAPMAARMIPGAGPGVSLALQAATPQLRRMLAAKRHMPPPGSPYAAQLPMQMQMPQMQMQMPSQYGGMSSPFAAWR